MNRHPESRHFDGATEPAFSVFATSFSRGDASRQSIGVFDTLDAALTAAAKRVLNDLWALHRFGQTAKELFDLWREAGDDVVLVPDDARAPFSATDFARLMTLRLTGDDRRPLVLEVTCTDCLRFSSGHSSPPKQWVFWVRAPATYAGATTIVRRATEVLYQDMSRQAYASEGSSYTLLGLALREASEAEVMQAKQASPGATVYVVQDDGSLAPAAT